MKSERFDVTEHLPDRGPATTAGRLRLPNLGLRFSERKILLALGDLTLLNLALVVALLVRGDFTLSPAALWSNLPWFLLASALYYVAGVFLDVYALERAANALLSALSAATAAFAAAAAFLLIPFVTPQFPARRLHFFLFPVLALAAIALWRLVYATLIVQPVFRRTAIVVGAGYAGRTLLDVIAGNGREPDAGHSTLQNTVYHVLGFIDDAPEKQGTTVAGVPVLGDRRHLLPAVRELQPDEVVLAITHPQTMHRDLFKAVLDCRRRGVVVTTMAHLYEGITGRVPVEHAGRNLHVLLPIAERHVHRIYVALRRCFDVVVALFGCLFMLFLVPPLWLVNRLACPGDLFYRQQRVGRGGHPFRILKFRSMVMEAESESGAVWAGRGDPRVTALGRFLRKTHLDEVPQFWNVLKGDMSLLGPRPERPAIVRDLSRHIPYYRMRHAVRPGISGWAQIKHRYGASVDDALVKLQYDLYYIKHQGPYLDFLILLKTIQVVLGLKGR